MAQSFSGFRFAWRPNNLPPTIEDIISADTALAEGDMVNLESGQADLAVTTDAAIIGMVTETKTGMSAGTTRIKVITDPDAVYAVYDANARLKGALLDIAGATGAQTVAASSGNEFMVVADSAADELTYVMINHGDHWSN